MRTNTFTYNGASITVREEIGADALDARLVIAKADFINWVDARESNRFQWFLDALLRSEVEGDLGFPWANAGSPSKVLETAYNGFLNASGGLVSEWTVELQQINRAPVDPDLLPPEMVSEEKKEVPA